MKLVYRYRMSRKAVAARLVLWVVVLYGWMVGLFLYGVPPDAPVMRWGLVGVTVVSAVLLGLAIWNWRHPAAYEVTVTSERLAVHYPGQAAWTFDVPVAEISHIENRFRVTHAGRRHDGHWIVMENGDTHRITTNYFGSIRRIHRALESVAPGIRYETVTTRSFA